jgi:flagellar biosynthetic protein FliQ
VGCYFRSNPIGTGTEARYNNLMENQEIIELVREAILITIRMGAPIMIIGLLVGVAIALVQALTQIQEMTLVFVPKILVIFLALFLLFPAMESVLGAYMELLADRMIGLGKK